MHVDSFSTISLSIKDHRKRFLNNNRILTTFQHSSSFNGLTVEKKSVKCILKIFVGVLKLGGRRDGRRKKKSFRDRKVFRERRSFMLSLFPKVGSCELEISTSVNYNRRIAPSPITSLHLLLAHFKHCSGYFLILFPLF